MVMFPDLIVDPALCTVCRACELACHYHHTGHFGTSKRSIRIRYDADTSEVIISFEDTCDACLDETESLCVHFCAPGAIATHGKHSKDFTFTDF